MTRKILFGVLAFGFVAGFSVAPAVLASDHEGQGHGDEHEGHGHSEAEMSGMPDPAKMQEIMQKWATPGQQHKKMNALTGLWDYTSTFWHMPGAEGMTSTGTTEYAWMHDGRYMRSESSGEAMGWKFTGTGIMGYDRYNEEYFSFWIDNMGTGTMMHTGQANEAGDEITFVGTYDDFWNGVDDKWSKMVLTIQDDDHHTLAMFQKTDDGSEFKNFEVVYTRAKLAVQ